MIGLLRSHREKIPFVGEILFSVLIFPLAFIFMQKWITNPDEVGISLWLCAFYVTMGMVRLFRGCRLRGQFRLAFVVQLACCVALAACGALSMIAGITKATAPMIALAFWVCMLAERALDLLRHRRAWRIAFNVVAMLMLIGLALTSDDEKYALICVGLVASFVSLLSIMILIFSRIRLDILKDIIRKTYAIEIVSGLLVMIVVFSNVLTFTDDAFPTYWDALWYCFAVVTTIGFGDLTPISGLGRFLSVILGVYGIVVVALITSIIVNFYGELKKTESN